MGVGIDAEAIGGAACGAVQRARAALLAGVVGERGEAEQGQDMGDGDGGAHGGEVDGGASGVGAGLGLVVLCLPRLFAAFAGLGELAIALGMDGYIVAEELVVGGDVADGAVQAGMVVMGHILGDDAAGVVERQGYLDADALAFDGFVKAFELAVGLRVIGRGPDVGHASDADEFFEILCDELRPVVADDARAFAGEVFTGALQNRFDVDFLHLFADFPVDDEAAVTVEDGAQEVEGAGDVEMADVDVPLLVRFEGLDEAGAFLSDGGALAGQESRGFEDAIDAGWAAGDDIGIEHHEGHAAISFEGVLAGEVADGEFFGVGEPMIARHPVVVFIDFAEACDPVVVFAAGDVDPGDEARDRDLGFVGPRADEIDDQVARVVGDPAAG